MKKQANARHCFVCGVENGSGLKMMFYQTGPGVVTAKIAVPEQFQGYPGVVHGGVIAAMLDEAAGRSLMGDGASRFMVTARLNVRYRKPVPVGVPLLVKGFIKEDRGRVAVAVSEVYDEADSLLAEAEAVLSEIPDQLSARFVDDGNEWSVYPDEELPDDH